jgi:hypothetical protein
MQKPCEGHWCAAKRVIRYLKGTQDFGLKYSKVEGFKLVGHIYSYFDPMFMLSNPISASHSSKWKLEITQTICSGIFLYRGKVYVCYKGVK